MSGELEKLMEKALPEAEKLAVKEAEKKGLGPEAEAAEKALGGELPKL